MRELSPRLERLRESVLNLGHKRFRVEKELTIFADEKMKTEPLIVRKAYALALALREMPLYIMDGELIVGAKTMFLSANYSYRERPLLGEIVSYKFPHYATEEEKKEAMKEGLREGHVSNHLSPNWNRLLQKGIGGIRREAAEKLEKLSPSENHTQYDFLRAVLIVMDGAKGFILRYVEEAKVLAYSEGNVERRRELEKIAEVCEWVSVNPPRSFYEALQLVWFCHCIIQTEIHWWIALGRFDQYMYPFYRNDLEEGRLSCEEAQELLDCFWIKFNTLADLNSDSGFNLILGGLLRDGRDGTNELSYLCLDTAARLKLPEPKVNVRIYKGSPDSFLQKACELIKRGFGQPAIYNDDVIIPSLQNVGVSLEDARDYCNDGCWEPIVDGKSNNWPFTICINLLKCVETVLEEIEKYSTFDELFNAFKRELIFQIRRRVDVRKAQDKLMVRTGFAASPFTSALLDNCLEKMKDLTAGGAVYNYTAVTGAGLANSADSLAAVKKFVYEDKVISKSELLEALHKNFEGKERLRQMLLNRAPKFGNDSDYVDLIAKEIVDFFYDEVTKHRNPRGGIFIPGLFTAEYYVDFGKGVGATPDGRKAGEFIASNASPMIGRAKNGPSAIIKSQTKIDFLKTPDGSALDIKFHPSTLNGLEGVKKMMAFIRTYQDLRGQEIQFNVVDVKTLRAAQTEPEKYRDLVVKVWGFTAHFIDLSREHQEHVIARTEHEL